MIVLTLPETILLFCALLFISILLSPLSKKFHFPYSIILILVGFIGSEFMVSIGFDTGLRWFHFRNIAFYMVLPVIIFEESLNINSRDLLDSLLPILILALPIFLISLFVCAVILYYLMGSPGGFPWLAAILTSVILSATDPGFVENISRLHGAPKKLGMLFRGESIFNDGLSIVLYSTVMAFALNQQSHLDLTDSLIRFIFVFFGGLGWGILGGLAFAAIFRWIKSEMTRALLSLIFAYAWYLAAELYLQISGVMTMLAAGLVLAFFYSRTKSEPNPFLKKLWTFFAHSAHALLFILVGMTITMNMFEQRWLAMLIAIAAVTLARAVGILGFFPLLNLTFFVRGINKYFRLVLFWGGLRGAIVVALALSLPYDLEYWFTIQSMAYGVVLFTLLAQATTIKLFMPHLREPTS